MQFYFYFGFGRGRSITQQGIKKEREKRKEKLIFISLQFLRLCELSGIISYSKVYVVPPVAPLKETSFDFVSRVESHSVAGSCQTGRCRISTPNECLDALRRQAASAGPPQEDTATAADDWPVEPSPLASVANERLL